MKELTKEECQKALNKIVDDSHKKYCDYKTQNAWGIISKLIKEYFEPKPYKFEDLKSNMWVWDDKKMDFYHVCEKIVNKDGTKILANETHYRLFEENRFFPITKALQYQGELK